MASNRLNNSEEGEEVVQEIFLNLWKRKESFQLKKGFENYFSVALKYEVINRRARRARTTSMEDLAREVYIEPSTEEAFHRFDLEQLQQQLDYRINQLPEKCRLVFTMSRKLYYSNKQIAKSLKISEKTVEKHVSNALKYLKSYFGPLLPIILPIFID